MGNGDRDGFAAQVALDWGDRKHVWALQAQGAEQTEQGELEHTPEAVEAWAAHLAERFEGKPVAVALEQSRGALLFILTKYAHLVLYPVHPGMLANYRKAMCPSGAKDDPSDSRLLLELLSRHGDRLRRWQPDRETTRTLQFLVEDRRQLVAEKTRQSNRLTQQLKMYFPQVLSWFEDIDTALVGDLLRRWPTLEELQKARPATLEQFFREHNCRRAERIQQRLEQIRQAIPATRDGAVLVSSVLKVRTLVRLLADLRQAIEELDRQIAERFAQEPDTAWLQRLPGAGPALAPRLFVAWGTQRERYQTAAEMQSYCGIAPLVERSGKKQWIHFRCACPKFLRQTFHEWAAQTVRTSQWAREFYEQRRARGDKHHAIIRALAFKWIRILYRCWKDRTPYDENRYLEALRRRRAPRPNASTNFRWETSAGFSRFIGMS